VRDLERGAAVELVAGFVGASVGHAHHVLHRFIVAVTTTFLRKRTLSVGFGREVGGQ
jgi:hypothetical protein